LSGEVVVVEAQLQLSYSPPPEAPVTFTLHRVTSARRPPRGSAGFSADLGRSREATLIPSRSPNSRSVRRSPTPCGSISRSS
jgi:hypothetical protein